MRKRSRILLFVLPAIAAGVLHAGPAAWGAQIDPEAERILKAYSAYLGEAKEFTFKADVSVDDRTRDGVWIQYGGIVEAAVRRPDRLRILNSGDLRETVTFYDGAHFTLYNAAERAYAVWDAPATVDEVVNTIQAQLGFTPPLSNLYRSDLYAFMTKMKDVRISHAGLHDINGTPCHHILAAGEATDIQAWIEEGAALTLRKLVISYKRIPGVPQYTAVFGDWDLSPRLPDLLFTFRPPAGAARIAFVPAETRQ